MMPTLPRESKLGKKLDLLEPSYLFRLLLRFLPLSIVGTPAMPGLAPSSLVLSKTLLMLGYADAFYRGRRPFAPTDFVGWCECLFVWN